MKEKWSDSRMDVSKILKLLLSPNLERKTKGKKKFSFSFFHSQPEFTAMREQYMRKGEGFIICYSITDRQSFEEAVEYKKLIDRVRNRDDIPVVLVGNKRDLEPGRKVSVSHIAGPRESVVKLLCRAIFLSTEISSEVRAVRLRPQTLIKETSLATD